MVSEEQYHYTVLTRPMNVERPRWRSDRKIAILISVIMFPLIMFCLAYLVNFGLYPRLIYPRSNRGEFERSLHRALLYNSVPKNSTTQYLSEIAPFITQTKLNNFKLVCYYSFPSSTLSLQPDEIDPRLCTHINAAFAGVADNKISMDDNDIRVLKELVKLKLNNHRLKILVCVGGASNDGGFSEMVMNHTNRKSFIQSIVYHVKTYHIDGIDLDWEFPNENGDGDKHQKLHFTQLLEEIRHTIDKQEPRHKFLLTVAVAAPYFLVNNSYEVPYMNQYVDFINLMTYDFHFYTRTTPFTGFNSPLYATDHEKDYLQTLNINFSSYNWNALGMDKDKIVVGLPTYGHTFRLLNPNNHGTYAPAMGYGRLGSNGFVNYPQVCKFLSINQITPVFDLDAKSPYASKYLEWISFDNCQSLSFKAEFIKDNNFGGAMVYCLNSDDYLGTCTGGKEIFPLIKTVKRVLNR